jgi:hypothetical protein
MVGWKYRMWATHPPWGQQESDADSGVYEKTISLFSLYSYPRVFRVLGVSGSRNEVLIWV